MGILKLLGAPALSDTINAVTGPLKTMVIVLLAIIALCAIVFAVWVAFRLAKAEDEGKRKEAKNQLLWSIIAAIVVVAVFGIVNWLVPALKPASMAKITTTNPEIDLVTAQLFLDIDAVMAGIFDLLTIGAIVFALYIGIRLATAQDEGKRKQAKQQLLWTLIAVVGIVFLSSIISVTMGVLQGAL